MDLQGQVALVTGGAIRVGRAISLALADAGADIVLNYRSSAGAAEGTAAEIRGRGRRVLPYRADVSQVDQVEAMVQAVIDCFGRLDILVNSASPWQATPLATVDEDTWDMVIDTNLKGPFFLTRAAAPYLAAHGHGNVINIVDLSSQTPFPDYLAHSVAKAGLLNMTYGLARELAPAVRVNAIAPGPVLPPPEYTPERIAATAARTPLRRWGSADDVANAILYLVSAPYVTGVLLPVDGGERLGSR